MYLDTVRGDACDRHKFWALPRLRIFAKTHTNERQRLAEHTGRHQARRLAPAATLTSAMPLRMVLVTCEPSKTAPRNSKTPARITACLIVRAFAPTEVAKALATSLAPIPKAAKKAPKAPTIRIHRNWSVASGTRMRSSNTPSMALLLWWVPESACCCLLGEAGRRRAKSRGFGRLGVEIYDEGAKSEDFWNVEAIRTSVKGSNPSPPQIFVILFYLRMSDKMQMQFKFLRANLQKNTKMNQTDDYIIESARQLCSSLSTEYVLAVPIATRLLCPLSPSHSVSGVIMALTPDNNIL